jgi:hypothetical protein
MPKKHSRAEQRKRFKLEAKRQSISLGELQKRLKSDGDSGAQEAVGVRTTQAGQVGVAEEGGNNTPALGIPASQATQYAEDGATTLVYLLPRATSVTRETGEAEDGHSYAKIAAQEAEDGHSHAKIPTSLQQGGEQEVSHAKIPRTFLRRCLIWSPLVPSSPQCPLRN